VNMKFVHLLLLCLVLLGSSFLSRAADPAPGSVVRVSVTNQPYDFFQPWMKKQPFSRRALGTVLPGGKVLVTGELVANATFVEIEKPLSGEKTPATIECVDYEANLALLKPADENFLADFKALEFGEGQVGDRADVLQLENTGELLVTSANLATVEVGRYPLDDTSLLLYRFSMPLQYRDSSFTIPVVKNGRLLAMLQRYDNRSQTGDGIPAVIIAKFVKDAADGTYDGFPRAGLGFSSTRDPQLRRYIGLNATGGVFITEMQKDGSAEKAGLQKGDVITSIAGKPIDQDGNYKDTVHGKIALQHLVSGVHSVGEKLKVEYIRDGKPATATLELSRRPPDASVIPPYLIDKAPRYYILGGLVMQELSRQYLREWGDIKKAPQRLAYYDRFQADLFEGKTKRVVFLSQVLPSPATVGYEQLSYLVITRINDTQIQSLDDVASAVNKPVNGFHKIEFDENPGVIYLDAAQVKELEPALMQNYGIRSMNRLTP